MLDSSSRCFWDGQWSLPPGKGGGNGCRLGGTIQLGAPCDHREVEEVLHAAVRLPQQHHGLVLLGDHGVDRKDPKSRGLELFQQDGIGDGSRLRCHGITETHGDLQSAACGAYASRQRDAGSAIGVVFSNGLRLDGLGIENDAIAIAKGLSSRL